MPVYQERFSEIYNGDSYDWTLDGLSLVRYSNGGVVSSASVDLSGITIQPGGILVVAKNQAAYEARWGAGGPQVIYSSTVDVNGDDVLALQAGGTILDVFGELGVDGTGEAWEYKDSCATRSAGVEASPIFNLAEWTISSDTTAVIPGSGGASSCIFHTCGDVNGDGVYDIVDVTSLTGYINGSVSLDSCELWASDVDGDGVVTAADQLALFNFLPSTTAYPGCL
jgi:hypothetical protein